MQYSLPLLEEDELEAAFEEMELLGFPLRNPFDLIAESFEKPIFSDSIQKYLGQRIETLGYLVALKKSITNRGEPMFFGTFIDVKGNTLVYYMGITGGGVWKTEDAGQTWRNISDGYFKTGSVGAVAFGLLILKSS